MLNKFIMTVLSSMLLIAFNPILASAETQSDVETLVRGNSAFTLDLYQQLRRADGNLFFSPYSISSALAMAYAGARVNTQEQMGRTLRFSLPQEKLHPAFAEVQSRLSKLREGGTIKLNVANSLWPQQDDRFLDEYLSLVKKYYGVSITPVDYKNARETARKMINKWVEEKTENKITNIIQPGVLDSLTRLVLVNAIYFKGKWTKQFKPSETKNEPFFVSPETSVQAPLMRQMQKFKYAELDSLQILELPYLGNDLSMLVLLPRERNGLDQLESHLSLENFMRWKGALREQKVQVFLPKFKTTTLFNLSNTLAAMGMVDAFDRTKADFSGMDGKPNWLYIGAVLHKAYVDVNEEGTEAAAATVVSGVAMGVPKPPPIFRADHPFLFLIQENQNGSILFMGRIKDPTKTGK